MGLIKVNIDGSKLKETGHASYGRLARNEDERWIEGFCGRTWATIPGEELWGMWQGLKLAKESAWDGAFIESESKNAVDTVNITEEVENHPECILVDDCCAPKREIKDKV